MAKTLKKLVSLLAVLALLMTIAPAALADDTVDTEEATTGDIAALTLEHVVGHQPAGMITEDLTLPTGYTWTAEPEGVIDTATGVITRHYVDDTAVTLTADSAGASKAFALTVKAKTTKIYARDTFAYDYGETADALKQTGFIFKHHCGNTDEVNVVHVKKDADGNSYLYDGMGAEGTNTSGNNINARVRWVGTEEEMSALNNEDVIYIEFNMNYTPGSAYSIFKLEAVKADGETGESIAATNDGVFRARNQDGGKGYAFRNGEWTSVAVKLDMNTKLVSVKVGTNDWVQNTNAVSIDKITSFRFVPGSMSSDCGTLLIDDFAIYSETADNLTTEEKAEYINSELAYENITNEKASALTANLTLPTAGGLVTWTSSDESVITSAGVITKAANLDGTVKSAVLTATYDGGSKVYNFAVVPEYYKAISDNLNEDFESGVAGNNLQADTATDLTNQSLYSGLGVMGTDSAPLCTYALDGNKGLVGKIENSEGEKHFGYSAGSAFSSQRFATGFDLNVAQLGEGTFTVSFNGGVAHSGLAFTKDSVTVNIDKGTATYPITPDANGWIRVDIDNNYAARAQNIYINGTALTGTVKNMLYTSLSANNTGNGNPLRTITFTIDGEAVVLIDNITVAGHNEWGRNNNVMADAAVKAAELYYGDIILGAGTSLRTVGPGQMSSTVVDLNECFATEEKSTGDWRTATIAYSGTAVENNVFSADKVGEYELTITAILPTANSMYGATVTKTITVKGAPVVIETGDTISVSGATTNGTLIVAQYDADGKMTAAKVYTTFDEIEVPEGSYKVFFITDMTTLIPGAFAVEK